MKKDEKKEKKSKKSSLKFFFIQLGVFASALTLASGTTFGIIFLNRADNTVIDYDDTDENLTPAEMLLSSMMELDVFSIDADLEFTNTREGIKGTMNVDGYADITDLNNVKVSGALDFKYDAFSVTGNVGYYNQNVYLDYNNSHLKMDTTSATINDIQTMFETAGITVALPDELTTLDFNKITDDLTAMDPVQTVAGYTFELKLSEIVTVYFISDDEYNFKGLSTNIFYYEDVRFYLVAEVEKVTTDAPVLVDPESLYTYQDFRPALNLIAGLSDFFGEDKNTIELAVDVDKHDSTNNTSSDLIALNGDISYNIGETQYAVAMDITEPLSTASSDSSAPTTRTHDLDFYVMNDGSSTAQSPLTLYLNHADVTKISFNIDNVMSIMTYTIDKIDNETLNSLLDQLVSGMADTDIMGMLGDLQNLNKWVENIDVQEDRVAITLNLSIFGLEMDSFVLYTSIDKSEFLGIGIENFIYNGYEVALSLMKKQYNMNIPSDLGEYVNFDYALGVVPSVLEMIKNDQFRLEFSGDVADTVNTAAEDINISGGIQFDITEKFGYGDVTILDRDNYSHNVKADYSYAADGQLLVSYNDELKGKMNNAEMTDLTDTVVDVVSDPDEHFLELFGDLLDSMAETPIAKVINEGDYGLIFVTNTFSDLSVSVDDVEDENSNATIKAKLSGDIIGLENCLMDITLTFNSTGITYIAADNIKVGDNMISFAANIMDFDSSKASNRLAITDANDLSNYIELSALTVLLKMGINTSKFNGYYIGGNITLTLIGLYDIDIPVDVKITNNKGDVAIAIEMPDIPIINMIFGTVNINDDLLDGSDGRSVSIYYQSGNWYLHRYDNAYETYGVFGTRKRYYNVNQNVVLTTDQFMDNIMYYLLDFCLGISEDTNIGKQIWDSINKEDTSTEEGYQIPYEKIVSNFTYNGTDATNSYFDVNIDFNALTGTSFLNDLIVKIGVDRTNDQLKYVTAGFSMFLGVIKVNAELTLKEQYLEYTDLDMSTMNTYVSAHANDTLAYEYYSAVRS